MPGAAAVTRDASIAEPGNSLPLLAFAEACRSSGSSCSGLWSEQFGGWERWRSPDTGSLSGLLSWGMESLPSSTESAHVPTSVLPSTSLVRRVSDDELEYIELLLRIDWRTAQVAALEEELGPLQRAFERFEWEYSQRLGHLQADLRRLRESIELIEHRTARIHARLVADPTGIMGDLFDQDELREIGDMFGIDVPDEWFAQARPGRHGRARDWDYADGQQDDAEEEILRRLQRQNRKRVPEETAAELRRRYRELARRFHPDLAGSEGERMMRQEIMLRINHAWHCQDLDALRAIDQEMETFLPGWSGSRFAARVAWARRECARLDANAHELVGRIRRLRASKTFPLWFNSTLGRTVITQRALAIGHDIERERERLEEAKRGFTQALAHYAAATA